MCLYLTLYILRLTFTTCDVYTHTLIATASNCCKTADLLNGSAAVQLQIKQVMVSIYLRIKQGLAQENITYFLVRKPSLFHQCEEKILDSSNMEIEGGTVLFSLKVKRPTLLSLIFFILTAV